jgi:hypothetical protein
VNVDSVNVEVDVDSVNVEADVDSVNVEVDVDSVNVEVDVEVNVDYVHGLIATLGAVNSQLLHSKPLTQYCAWSR